MSYYDIVQRELCDVNCVYLLAACNESSMYNEIVTET